MLFKNIYQNLPAECVNVLLSQSNVRIERIISHGHSTPVNQWYDQLENEWVMVLEGFGIIEYENGEKITLEKGDFLYLPAHLKHRVAATCENEQTVWLAIFWN
jgi:cupin 2 domain-containing protein